MSERGAQVRQRRGEKNIERYNKKVVTREKIQREDGMGFFHDQYEAPGKNGYVVGQI